MSILGYFWGNFIVFYFFIASSSHSFNQKKINNTPLSSFRTSQEVLTSTLSYLTSSKYDYLYDEDSSSCVHNDKVMFFSDLTEILYSDNNSYTYDMLNELRDMNIYPIRYFDFADFSNTIYSRFMSVFKLFRNNEWNKILDVDNKSRISLLNYFYGDEKIVFSYVNEVCSIPNDLNDEGLAFKSMNNKVWSKTLRVLNDCISLYVDNKIDINGKPSFSRRVIDTFVLLSPTEAYWTDKYVAQARDSIYEKNDFNGNSYKIVYTKKYKSCFFHESIKSKICIRTQAQKFAKKRMWRQNSKQRTQLRNLQRDYSFEELHESCFSKIRKIGDKPKSNPHPRNKKILISEGNITSPTQSDAFVSMENDLLNLNLRNDCVESKESPSSADEYESDFCEYDPGDEEIDYILNTLPLNADKFVIKPKGEEEISFISDVMSVLEKKLSNVITFVDEHKGIIRFATSTSILLYQLVKSSSFGEYVSCVAMYALANNVEFSLDAIKKYARRLFSMLTAFFSGVRSEGLTERFQLFTSRLLHSELIATLRELLLSVVSLRFFSKDVAGQITKVIGTPRKMCMADMMESIMGNVCTLLSIGDALLEGKPVYEILTGKNPVIKCIDAMNVLLMYRDKLFAGNNVPGCMGRKLFVKKGEELVFTAEQLLETMNPMINSMGILASLKATLSYHVAQEKSVLLGNTRIMPFAIIVFGEPGVGKSTVLDSIMRLFATIKGADYDDSLVYHRVRSSEYWEGYDMLSHLIVHYSEVGNVHPDLVKNKGDDILTELCTIIDSLPAPLNRAFGDKGKVFAIPELIIIDTNNENLNLDLVLCNPAAVKRRFLYIKPIVKDEFRVNGSNSLDSSKVLESDVNPLKVWNFEVFSKVPTSNTSTISKYYMTGRGNSGIVELLRLLRKMMIAWLDSQTAIKDKVRSTDVFDQIYDEVMSDKSRIQEDIFAEIKESMGIDIVDIIEDSSGPIYHTSNNKFYNSEGKEVRRKVDNYVFGVKQKSLDEFALTAGKYKKGSYISQRKAMSEPKETSLPPEMTISEQIEAKSEGFFSPWKEEEVETTLHVNEDTYQPIEMIRSVSPPPPKIPLKRRFNQFLSSTSSRCTKWCLDSTKEFSKWSTIKFYGSFTWMKRLLIVSVMLLFLGPVYGLSYATNYGKEYVRGKIDLYFTRFTDLFDFESTKFISKNPKIRKIVNVLMIISVGVLIKKLISRHVLSSESTDYPPKEELQSFEEQMDAGASRHRVPNKLDHKIWNIVTEVPPVLPHRNGLDELSNRILKNTFAVTVVKENSITEKTNVVGLESNIVAINTHVLGGTSSVFPLTFSSSAQITPNLTPHLQTYYMNPNDRYDLGNDITLLRVEGKMFKSILKHIPDTLSSKRYMSKLGYNSIVATCIKGKQVVKNEFLDYEITDFAEYVFPGHKPGMCGSPLTVDLETAQGFVGIHTAGEVNGDRAYASLFDKKSLLEGIVALKQSGVYIHASSQGALMEVEMPLSKSPVNYLPMNRFSVIGKLPGYVLINKKSKLVKTPFFKKIQELFSEKFPDISFQEFSRPMMKPTVVDGSWISPYNVALEKISSERADVSDVVMDKVIDICTERFDNLLPADILLKPLTLESAVNGVEIDPFTRRINLSTSSGFGFEGVKRDHFIRGEDGIDRPTEEIISCVNSIFKRFENREDSGSIYSAQLKDEPRAVEKVVVGKTRLFYMSPLDLLLVQRMLLSPFYTLMSEYGQIFCTAIGTNMHSSAGLLRKRLYSFSKYIIEGDYSNYDQKMPFKINAAACKIIVNILRRRGYNNYAISLVEACLSDSLQPLVEVNNDLFRIPSLRCSGKYATAEDNSLCGMLLPMVFWYSHPVLKDLCFFDYVLLLTYGDDVLMSVKEEVIEHFNALSYRDFIRSLNMDFTNPSKTEVDSKFTDIENISFLKRTFVYRDDISRWLAPLDISSIRRSLMWTLPSNNVAMSEQLYGSLQAALYELAFHFRREEFDSIREQLCSFYRESFPLNDVTFFTFDEIFSNIFGEDFFIT